MAPGEGHAYLGYINLALGMLRAVDPATPYATLHDRLTAALAERLDRAPTGLIETYPGETWPPDVAAVAGSIGLHAAVTGVDRRALLERWARRFEACALHSSGYLVQRVKSGSCKPVDAPRGSGTAIASYFLSFADARLSRRLFESLRTDGRVCAIGFCGIREYARGFHGKGDGDAGPMLMGVSVGATGFTLGAARAHGDARPLSRALSQRAPGRRAGRRRGRHEVRGGRHARQRAAARDADREPRRAAGGRRRRRTRKSADDPPRLALWRSRSPPPRSCTRSQAITWRRSIRSHGWSQAAMPAVVIAAMRDGRTRLFLFFVAPGWAAHVVGGALVRRAGYVPPK